MSVDASQNFPVATSAEEKTGMFCKLNACGFNGYIVKGVPEVEYNGGKR